MVQRSVRIGWFCLLLAMAIVLIGPDSLAADWPQWRHDAHRSGATDEQCGDGMALQWSLDLGLPDPAFDHQYRMCADATYAPVAGRGKLFVPSNRGDSVTAFDMATGDVVWRRVAEGPVRMAPLLLGDSVLVGSDDGHLCCVDADEGTLRWRRRGVPESTPDCRMLVNGRLCSRWPVRGAAVEAEGVVYFGAGLWPEEGAYVSAVDAETGRLLWRSARLSYLREGMSDHGRAYDLSLPPQGYLAVIDGKLAVPSGRSLAAWFDLETGEMEPYSCFYVKLNPPRGTWYLSGTEEYFVQGGNWFGTRRDALPPIPPALKESRSGIYGSRTRPQHELDAAENRPFINAVKYALHNENLYPEPVLTETTAYASELDSPEKYLVPRGHTRVSYPPMDRIVARDLTRPAWLEVGEKLHLYPEGTKIRRIEFPVLWQMESPLRVLIKAGSRLVAGEEGSVASIAIPEEGEDPSIVWRADVAGNPVNALVASGRLVVTTDQGALYCFGTGPAAASAVKNEGRPPWPVPTGEYAICIGQGSAERARDLAADGRYRVVVFEPTPARAAELRQALAAEGIEAARIHVVPYTAGMHVTPYWASLVVLGPLSEFAERTEAVVQTALNVLRPLTGRLETSEDFDEQSVLKQLIATRPGYELRDDTGRLVVLRTGQEPGSDDWTHESGGSANRFSNSEQRVRWPLATLWYSGEIDRSFTPETHFQHERNPYPLVAGGRMFIITHENLHAIDIYTGRYLWQAEMPKTPWVEARYQDSRIYGRPVDRNYVATDDAVYVILEEEIHVYSAKDGTKLNVLTPPEDLRTAVFPSRWTEVRIEGDLLYAVVGDTLVALNRFTGEPIWRRKSTLETTTYALGNGRLIGLDFVGTKVGGRGRPGTVRGPMFALDAETGEAGWIREVEYENVPRHRVDHERPWLVPPNPELAYNGKHDLIVLTARRNSVHVFRAEDGQFLWHKEGRAGNTQRTYSPVVTDDYLVLSEYAGFFAYVLDLKTGEDRQDAGIPRPRTCARIIGNNHLLVYRDAATELYDLRSKRMIGLNSVRSGCTTSFIPAGGILAAPMLGHGCVCNYPMFASQALYHTEALEAWRPRAVVDSWGNQAVADLATTNNAARRSAAFPKSLAEVKVEAERFQLTNATVEKTGAGLLFGTRDEKPGYAVRPVEKPSSVATFRFAVKRASGPGRHGNAFFLVGPCDDPDRMIQCRLYYGGRSSLGIAGPVVEPVEAKADLRGRDVYEVTVRVDCPTGAITFESAGHAVTAKLKGKWKAITHYGYGGSNSDNLFTGVSID